MAKQEPLKVITKVVRGDEIILYDDLSREEKAEFGKRMNRRAIRAVAKLHGYEVEFIESSPSNETSE